MKRFFDNGGSLRAVCLVLGVICIWLGFATQVQAESGEGTPKTCEEGTFRIVPGEGDCVPKTCENGGLGPQDCPVDPEPCAEGFERREDGNCYEIPTPDPEPPHDPPDGTPIPACDSDFGPKVIQSFLVSGGITRNDIFEEYHWDKCSTEKTLRSIWAGRCDEQTASLTFTGCRPNGFRWITFAPNIGGSLMEWEISHRGVTNLYRKVPGTFEVERQQLDGSWRTLYLGHLDFEAFSCP